MSEFFGKPWEQWIADYSASHQHPVNKACHKVGIPLIVLSIMLLLAGIFSITLFWVGVCLFVLGWILQFVGHIYERKPPEFFKDWRFLFVGLRWWWQHIGK